MIGMAIETDSEMSLTRICILASGLAHTQSTSGSILATQVVADQKLDQQRTLDHNFIFSSTAAAAQGATPVSAVVVASAFE